MCVRVSAAVRASWSACVCNGARGVCSRARFQAAPLAHRAHDNNFSERSRPSVCGRRRRAAGVSCWSAVVVMVVVVGWAVVGVEEVVSERVTCGDLATRVVYALCASIPSRIDRRVRYVVACA